MKKFFAVLFAVLLVATAPAVEAKLSIPGKTRSAAVWSSNYSQGLSPEANAIAHWEKHKAEFPEYQSAQEYIAAAHGLIANPGKNVYTKYEEDGDKLFYFPKKNIFLVVTPRGIPRTMFKPKKGKAYFDAQK